MATVKPSSTRQYPATSKGQDTLKNTMVSHQMAKIEIISETSQQLLQQDKEQFEKNQIHQIHSAQLQPQTSEIQTHTHQQHHVEIILRESTKSNQINKKKDSLDKKIVKISEDSENKSVYRKFFKRIKTILDGNIPHTKKRKCIFIYATNF